MHEFKRKPLAIGIPTVDSDIGQQHGVLLNTARNSEVVTSTPYDEQNEWVWRNRLAIETGGSSIIYIDGAGTPYSLSVSCVGSTVLGVRTRVTLSAEYGLLGKGLNIIGKLIFDDVLDFTPLADDSFIGTLNEQAIVEQSPSGSAALLNVAGSFSTGASVAEGERKLAGIIKLTISGTVDENGNGLSCSQSIYKDTIDCSPSQSGFVQVQDFGVYHYELDTTVTLDSVTSLGGADPRLREIVYSETRVVRGVLGELSHVNEEPEWTYRHGTRISRNSQNLIIHSHYDDDGAIVDIGLNMREELVNDYDRSFTYILEPFTFATQETVYNDNGEADDTVGVSWGQRTQVENKAVSETHDFYRKYTFASTLNGVEKAVKSYEHRVVDETNSGGESGAAATSDGQGGFSTVTYTDPYDEAAAGWGAQGWWTSGTTTEVEYEFGSKAALDPFSSEKTYSASDWGVVIDTSIADNILDKKFSDMKFELVNNRWAYLKNKLSGEITSAVSIYGETDVVHSDDLYYNHHTKIITDAGV